MKPNELVGFLAGRWENVSFEVADGRPITREAYPETMRAKDADTLTITAHGYRDGQDLTRDMELLLRGEELVLRQAGFEARGRREGNVYFLTGTHGDREYRFRLYALGDKYVFHRETWQDGAATQIDMSYLERC